MRSQNIKVNNVGSFSSVGKAGCLGLLALGLALVNPVGISAQAFAEEDSEVEDVPTAQELLASSVQIAFGTPVGTSSLTPVSGDGASAKYSVKATVDVTNSGGYTVYIGSNKSELTGKNTGTTINSVTSSSSYEEMPVNSWGYSYTEGETAGTTFSAMPANVRGVVLGSNNSTDIKTDRKTFTLSFAAHIGNDKPADIYENEVTVSVVSSPLEITGLTSINNLQDMTSGVCEASEIGDEKQLKDTRDGKYYWVSKLADGKCWMTQNLDLDLSTSKALTPSDSDVTSNWTPGYTTATTATSSTINTSDTGQNSWSLGDYRITSPTDAAPVCDAGLSSAAGCPARFTAYSTPTSANGSVDAHYILGNHYQWNAATAGTGGTMTSGQATSSICPKGWRLPTGTSSGEFRALVVALGVQTSATGLTAAPFYAVRGGAIYQNQALLRYASNYGRYWASTVSDSEAHDLSISGTTGSTSVSASSNSHPRSYGASVRCIAR